MKQSYRDSVINLEALRGKPSEIDWPVGRLAENDALIALAISEFDIELSNVYFPGTGEVVRLKVLNATRGMRSRTVVQEDVELFGIQLIDPRVNAIALKALYPNLDLNSGFDTVFARFGLPVVALGPEGAAKIDGLANLEIQRNRFHCVNDRFEVPAEVEYVDVVGAMCELLGYDPEFAAQVAGVAWRRWEAVPMVYSNELLRMATQK